MMDRCEEPSALHPHAALTSGVPSQCRIQGAAGGVLAYWGQTPEGDCAEHWIMDGLVLPLVEAYSFDETEFCVLNSSRTKIMP